MLVTNEGNAELTQGLPKTHIVIASLEKVVPTFEDACTLLRVLARSATGQEFAAYTTVLTGPKRPADLDGPTSFHVVLLDNGRSAMLGSEFQDILRCIRCGACMNHCPVYLTTGGHAYGWVYPGPMGAVLTPSFIGIEQAHHLPSASTFCGRCEEVCPVRIPLPKMMRHWREQQFGKRTQPAGGALRHAAVGVRGQAAGALSRRCAHRHRPARASRPRDRSLSPPAARRRLDRLARLSGAAGRDLPGAVARAWEAAVSKEARDAVLGRVRRSLGRDRDPSALRRDHRATAQRAAANLIPARANLDRYGRIGLFTAQAEAVQTTVRRVDRYRDLPRAVVDYLRVHNLPPLPGHGERSRCSRRPTGRARCWSFTTDRPQIRMRSA